MQSQRSNPKVKPRFPRLQFMQKKRESELEFFADDDFMIHVKPNRGAMPLVHSGN